FQAEDGIRDRNVTGVQTCALPIFCHSERLTIQAPAEANQRNEGIMIGPMMSVSPDGKFLASISSDKKIHLWNLTLGKHERVIPAPAGPIFSLAFAPDGKYLTLLRSKKQEASAPTEALAQEMLDLSSGKGKPSLRTIIE